MHNERCEEPGKTDRVKNHLTRHVCTLCDGKVFASSKALLQHLRIKHKERNPIIKYLRDSSICPACHVDFRSRLRLITHASETRVRGKAKQETCHKKILTMGLPQIEKSVLDELNKRDTAVCRNARRSGRTHEPAVLAAIQLSRKRLRTKTPAAEAFQLVSKARRSD